MKRLLLALSLICGVLLGGTQAEAKKASKLVVLDFEEQGKVAPGAGKTLATLLYSSINPRSYFMVDPSRLRSLLKKHRWHATHTLSDDLLKALKKQGVKMILTGTVGQQYDTFSASYRAVYLSGRLAFSEVIPPTQSWTSLVASLQYSVKMLLRRSSTKQAKKARKIVRKGKKGKKGKKKKKKRSALKEFAKVIKGAKRVKGLFPLYTKTYRGKRLIFMEVSPKQLNKIFLFSPTLEGGAGESSLITFAQLRGFPFVLVRQDHQVLLMEKNVKFRADPKSKIARVLNRSFTDSLHASTKVLSKPHPKRKTFLVDFRSLFFKNLAGLSMIYRYKTRYLRRPLPFDKSHSRFGKIQNFPKNLEIELKAFFRKPKRSVAIPPGYGMRLTLRYSLSALPDTGYRPRLADDRVGHFGMIAKDYTHDNVNTRYIRYISRWHLEKKYPKRAVSPPKKPIVYWLENAIPLRYRKAVRQGVLLWKSAFRNAGFSNAIRVRQQPAKAKWDPADVRYSTIRWFLANKAGFAQGPSRFNPLTGQIYDADIRVSADMAMLLSQRFRLTVSPVKSWSLPGMEMFSHPSQKMDILRSLKQALHNFDQPRSHHHDHGDDPLQQTKACDYGRGAMQQAALGWHLLQLRGKLPNPALEKKFVNDFIVSVIAHEVGHTLGLRHNFKASTLHSYEDLHNPKKTKKMGLTNSVMEYTPVNLALPGQKQGEYWQSVLGPYDHWAIEYAYKPIPQAKTIKAEKPYLEKIASKVAKHKLAYATDEDAFGILSPDPDAQRWDLGRDSLRYFQTRTQLALEMWKRIEKKFGTPRYTYQLMRRAFGVGLGTYIRAGMMASRYVGGIYHRRDHIGDPKNRLPFKPVPAARQREALNFLTQRYFSPNAFEWPASLLNKLAPTRFWDFTFSIWGMRVDYPIHRAVMMMQAMPLFSIFHPLVLDRIQDTRLRLPKGKDYFGMTELFSKVTAAIWAELATPKTRPTTRKAANDSKPKATKTSVTVDSFRRNLQWYHLRILGMYARAKLATLADASNLARLQLKGILAQVKAALPRSQGLTQAHLERCKTRIELLLKPTLITR